MKTDYTIWSPRELIERIHQLEKSRTICIEIEGGVLQAVHGLRDGDDYTLADYDDAEMDEHRKEECDMLITIARLQK